MCPDWTPTRAHMGRAPSGSLATTRWSRSRRIPRFPSRWIKSDSRNPLGTNEVVLLRWRCSPSYVSWGVPEVNKSKCTESSDICRIPLWRRGARRNSLWGKMLARGREIVSPLSFTLVRSQLRPNELPLVWLLKYTAFRFGMRGLSRPYGVSAAGSLGLSRLSIFLYKKQVNALKIYDIVCTPSTFLLLPTAKKYQIYIALRSMSVTHD